MKRTLTRLDLTLFTLGVGLWLSACAVQWQSLSSQVVQEARASAQTRMRAVDVMRQYMASQGAPSQAWCGSRLADDGRQRADRWGELTEHYSSYAREHWALRGQGSDAAPVPDWVTAVMTHSEQVPGRGGDGSGGDGGNDEIVTVSSAATAPSSFAPRGQDMLHFVRPVRLSGDVHACLACHATTAPAGGAMRSVAAMAVGQGEHAAAATPWAPGAVVGAQVVSVPRVDVAHRRVTRFMADALAMAVVLGAVLGTVRWLWHRWTQPEVPWAPVGPWPAGGLGAEHGGGKNPRDGH